MENTELIDNIKFWTLKKLGPSFQFRQHQFETIYDICENIINNKADNQIIEAPTGSGKSLTILISAGVLADYYDKTSYILCSDLLLWQQYATTIDNKKLKFGKIKGTINNYICNVNGEDLSAAPCRLKMIPFAQLYDENSAAAGEYSCANSCEYIVERRRALRAKVTLMPYQLFGLLPLTGKAPWEFKQRDIIFCDECHNIPNIAQMLADPDLQFEKDYEKLEYFCNWARSMNMFEIDFDNDEMKYAMTDSFDNLFKIEDGNNNKEDLFNQFDTYTTYARKLYAGVVPDVNEYLKDQVKKNGMLSHDEKRIKSIIGWMDDYVGTIIIFVMCCACGKEQKEIESLTLEEKKTIIKKGASFLIKTTSLGKNEERIVTMKYAKEDMMSQMFILGKAQYKVLMSATIGNKDSFEDNTGIKIGATLPVFYKRVPSTFDFSQSPIYFLPKFKMTRDLIESNMPHMAKLISMIVKSNKHVNTRGIIHTGSYKNAMDVYNMVDDDIKNRCIIYTNSKEKEEKIYEYMSKPDSILIGPTLTEGIDLPDDGCRFIIIMKVPFPYLGDELVKAKIHLFPKWYNAETSNNIIQGIGRGNRHMYDWCVTYILDGSFKNLYDVTRNQYPFEMQKRIQMVNTQL